MGNASAVRAFEQFFGQEKYFVCVDCTYGRTVESEGIYSWTLLSSKGSIVLRSYKPDGSLYNERTYKIISMSGSKLKLRNKAEPYLLCSLDLCERDGSWILLDCHHTEYIYKQLNDGTSYKSSTRLQYLQLRSKHVSGSLNKMGSIVKDFEAKREAQWVRAGEEREEKERRARAAKKAEEAREIRETQQRRESEQKRQREQKAQAVKDEQEKRDRAKRLEEQRQQAASTKVVVGYPGTQGNAATANKSDYHPKFGFPYRRLVPNTLGAGTLNRLVNKARNMYIDVWVGVFIPVGAGTEACYTQEGRLMGNILSGSVVPQVVVQSLYPLAKVTLQFQTIDFNYDMQTSAVRGMDTYSQFYSVTFDFLYLNCCFVLFRRISAHPLQSHLRCDHRPDVPVHPAQRLRRLEPRHEQDEEGLEGRHPVQSGGGGAGARYLCAADGHGEV